jgi:hypothetical protein
MPAGVSAQAGHRIYGRVHMVSGQIHEGFIRWDRNEGGWADLLDGTKELPAFEYQDWWRLAHPGDERRDRVIELAGYRITWDDHDPDLPSSVESGIRFGHLRRLTPSPSDSDRALLELKSGLEVELSGGSTDLGPELRQIQVVDSRGGVVELEWEDLAFVEFLQAPSSASSGDARLHGTVTLRDGSRFQGYLAWDVDKILSSDLLEARDADDRRRSVPFSRIVSIRPTDRGAVVALRDGERMELFGTDDVDDGNDGIVVSDPGLGQVEIDWEEMESVRFHRPEPGGPWDSFAGGDRLFGTVLTSDSTRLTGWIRWDGDEEYEWEMLNGRAGGVEFQVELGLVSTIQRYRSASVTVTVGPTGADVDHPVEEGSKVTLRDGRVLVVDGSNDVDESNHGVFVLPQEFGHSPDDEDALWIMVRWGDFLALNLDEGEGS